MKLSTDLSLAPHDDSFWVLDEFGWQWVTFDQSNQLRNGHGEVAETQGVVSWSPGGRPADISWDEAVSRWVDN